MILAAVVVVRVVVFSSVFPVYSLQLLILFLNFLKCFQMFVFFLIDNKLIFVLFCFKYNGFCFLKDNSVIFVWTEYFSFLHCYCNMLLFFTPGLMTSVWVFKRYLMKARFGNMDQCFSFFLNLWHGYTSQYSTPIITNVCLLFIVKWCKILKSQL